MFFLKLSNQDLLILTTRHPIKGYFMPRGYGIAFSKIFHLHFFLIDFNGMPSHVGLFYAKRFGNRAHCTHTHIYIYIFIFFCVVY